jgi:hypothetical protein
MSDASGALSFNKWAFIEQMETDPEGLAESLGGPPFAIICPKGQQRRWRRTADYLGLLLFESDKVGATTRDDSMLIIHAGEVTQWLPNIKEK